MTGRTVSVAPELLILSLPSLLLGSLLCWLLAAQGWDWLELLSLMLVLLLLQIGFLSWCTQRYLSPWRWVSLSCDAMRHGEHNLRIATEQLPAYCQQGLAELTRLQQQQASHASQLQTEQQLFQQLWQWLPYPVLLFDQKLQLCFTNKAAADFLQRPLLQGQSSVQCGFTEPTSLQLPLALCPSGWRQQQLQLTLGQQQYQLWFALDLRQALHAGERQSQTGLVRVLAHELRNSLSPMASMTQTLLAQPAWQTEQVRQVLSRIGLRATRLLKFIDTYREISELPPAQPTWFRLDTLVARSAELLNIPVNFQGESWCFADPLLFEQLWLNLLKNAQQAPQPAGVPLQIRFYQHHQQQHFSLQDAGPGFANPANLFTPFYTTKPEGQGVGLTLCRDILHLHQGQLLAQNTTDSGALLTASWPLPANAGLASKPKAEQLEL